MKRAMILGFLLGVFHFSGFGQTVYGSVRGTITDTANVPLNSAQILLRTAGSGGPGGTTYDTILTGANGTYLFDSLAITNTFRAYTLLVSKTGYAPDSLNGAVTINNPNDSGVDFSLMPVPELPVLVPVASPTVSRRPMLKWSSVNGAATYTVQVSRTPFFGTTVVNVNTSDTFFTPLADLPIDTLYWRVSSDLAPAYYTTPGSFIILDPAIPMLVAYTPDPTTDRRPTLQWYRVSGAESYDIVIDNSASFASPLATVTVNDTFFTPLSDLPLGPIYWHVLSTDSSANNSAYSMTDAFTIQSDSIPLLYGYKGDTVAIRRPVFAWMPVPGATSYQIVIDNSANFGSPVVSLTVSDTSFTPLANLANGKYYWHVSSDLVPGTYSATDSVVVLPPSSVEAAAGIAPVFSASPNPFASSVTLRYSGPGAAARIAIYSASGTRVYSGTATGKSELTWNAEGFPAGFYLARVESGKAVYRTRLVLLR